MTDTLHLLQAAPSSSPAGLEPPADESTFNTPVALHAAGPTVVVKRRKTLGHGAHAMSASQEPGAPERTPRVFRVASAVQDAEENGGDAHGAQQHAMDDAKPPPMDAVRAAAGARRRRRVPRQPVTIIRPGENLNPTIPAAEFRDAPASPSVCVEPDRRFGQSLDDHRRSIELQLKIEALRQEAQRLKKAEAAAAVGWIRKAIATYGIDVTQLGL